MRGRRSRRHVYTASQRFHPADELSTSPGKNGRSAPQRRGSSRPRRRRGLSRAWEGIELFLEPGREILVARDGDEVAAHVGQLDTAGARSIGEAACRRVLAEHTYAHRAAQLEALLEGSDSVPAMAEGMA